MEIHYSDRGILHDRLMKEGMIDLSRYVDKKRLDELANAAIHAVEHYSKRKDFISMHGGRTPRNMRTVNRENIDKIGTLIGDFYRDPAVLCGLQEISGDPVQQIDFKDEQYLINVLERDGDTHGWHFDDYSYALVIIVESPPQGVGGTLQYVPNCNNDKKRASFHEFHNILKTEPIREAWLPSRSVYLMRSLTTLHRVSPIHGNGHRISIAMSYGVPSDETTDHRNIDDLYA